jgi:protein-disulfide isomerase
VTIVEFSEFQCPFCARVAPTLRQIEDTYQGKVRIVWKHLPLAIHKDAVGAALAAEAARKQGKFWEYHDRLFANQSRLGPDELKLYAKDLQLDLERFEADLLNGGEKKRIEADVAEARKLGINGTPGIFINGRFINGAQPFERFAAIIDQELTRLNVAVPSPSSE